MPFRVLSFDGGPNVGAYVRCLQAIEAARPGFLDRVDLLIGSSAGACTSVFLAGRLAPGADGAAVAADAVDYADGVLRAMAPQDGRAYKRLLTGAKPLIESTGIRAHLSENTGDFASLPRRVSVLSCSARAPYDPLITSNYGRGASAEDSVDVVVRSSSLPVWSAPHQGRIDGALFTNNPSTTGLLELIASTRGTDEQVDLDDVVLLSFGGDDGNGKLSNLRCPGASKESKISKDPMALLKKLGVPVDKAMKDAAATLGPLQEEMAAKLAELGLSVAPGAEEDGEPGAGEDSEDWGWRQWLAYPGNLAYVLQVWVASEGRGAHWQCEQLLGERALRVAPMGPLPTNEALLALFLGQPEPVIEVAKLTGRLWSDPPSSKAMGFDVDVLKTLAWVDEHWMADAPAGERAPTDAHQRAQADAGTPPRRRKRDRLADLLKGASTVLRGT